MKFLLWAGFAVFFTLAGWFLCAVCRRTKEEDFRRIASEVAKDLRLIKFQTAGMTSADLHIYQRHYIATVKACVDKMQRLIEEVL